MAATLSALERLEIRVALEELNTAFCYHLDHNEVDELLELFTDDVFLRRPLYGAVNLVYGLGFSVYGLGAAPFDGGARLHAGATGVMWSLPELGFVNVRKGSFDWSD